MIHRISQTNNLLSKVNKQKNSHWVMSNAGSAQVRLFVFNDTPILRALRGWGHRMD